MPKLAAGGNQKFFDPKSLKSVASCAGVIYIIVHLIDYLSNFEMNLTLLNFIILTICLVITFFFVVNELGKLQEKIALGLANAALLFFSVIGFNGTYNSDQLANRRNAPHSHQDSSLKINWHMPSPKVHVQYASLFDFLQGRNWMPPAALVEKIDSLTDNNDNLQKSNQMKTDSLTILLHRKPDSVSIKRYSVTNGSFFLPGGGKTNVLYIENKKLRDSLRRCQSAQLGLISPTSRKQGPDTTKPYMNKENYIESYKTLKAQYDADVRKCQSESNEYKGKYNQLLIAYKKLMDKIGGDNP